MSIPSSIYHCFIVKKKTFKVLSSGFVKYSDTAFLLSTVTCCTETQQGFLSLPDCSLEPTNQPLSLPWEKLKFVCNKERGINVSTQWIHFLQTYTQKWGCSVIFTFFMNLYGTFRNVWTTFYPHHTPASTSCKLSDNSNSDLRFSDNQRSSALFSDARCSHECFTFEKRLFRSPACSPSDYCHCCGCYRHWVLGVLTDARHSPQSQTPSLLLQGCLLILLVPRLRMTSCNLMKVNFFLILSLLPVVWGSGPKTCKHSDVLLCSFRKRRFKVLGHI